MYKHKDFALGVYDGYDSMQRVVELTNDQNKNITIDVIVFKSTMYS